MTSAQLQLITSDKGWKLDKRTVEVGRAGVAQARAALEAATALKEEFAPEHKEDQASSPKVTTRETAGETGTPGPRYVAQTLTGQSSFGHPAAA